MSERDSGIALLRAMARAHRALAEHNEEGPEGWRKEVVDLATGTRTVADDFDAIAERLLAAEARAVRCEGVVAELRFVLSEIAKGPLSGASIMASEALRPVLKETDDHRE